MNSIANWNKKNSSKLTIRIIISRKVWFHLMSKYYRTFNFLL